MPVLRVHPNTTEQPSATETDLESARDIEFTEGDSLRSILSVTDLRVQSGCLGYGGCGLCLVRIESGEVNEPTMVERIQLDQEPLDEGVRLACQVFPSSDLCLRVLNPAPPSNWKVIPRDLDRFASVGLGVAKEPFRRDTDSSAAASANVRQPCGIAIDLGTSFVSLSVWSLTRGNCLTTRCALNPQVEFGADIVTRLVGAAGNSETRIAMGRALIDGMAKAFRDVSAQDGIDLQRVLRVTVVANTAMLLLFSDRDPEVLLDTSNWSRSVDCSPAESRAGFESWGIHPTAQVDVVQPVAGFVGSDFLAGVLAARLTEMEAGTLMIDFGTNSEIGLWDGHHLWVTSSAGGPAFEGSGISCGMPAQAGAIFRVEPGDEGELHCATVLGAAARGVCGSGVVDLIACLLDRGDISPTGAFARSVPERGFIVEEGGSITLSKKDIDVIQRAKAAVAAGVAVLLERAQYRCELSQVLVSGAFGAYLDIANAQRIGLLPVVPPERVVLCGNTALVGSEQLLLSKEAREELARIRGRIRMVNLADCEDFEELFFENLHLRPDDSRAPHA